MSRDSTRRAGLLVWAGMALALFSMALAAMALFVPPTLAEDPQELIDFELKDQFDRVYNNQSWAGRGLILVGSDRHGSEYNGGWSQALRSALEDHGLAERFAMVGHADVRGVPFFVRGNVKSKFPEDEESWVLLDWKGIFPKAYGFEKRSSNTLVFGANGALLYQTHGLEVEPEKIEAAVAAILSAPKPQD